jgi:hypothetical protein
MKLAIAIAAAGLASLGIAATPAAAYHLSPSGNFTADGDTSATKNGITLPCHAHFTGNVNDAGVGRITGASFTTNGGPPGACEAVTVSNTPWKAVAKSAKKVTISKVTFSTPIGDCGPSNLPIRVKNDGSINFTAVPMAGSCTVSGNLATTPKLTIVP